MTPTKRKPASREEMLLNIIQRISTEATCHMVAVTEAIGELRSYIDDKMSEMLISCTEARARQDRATEKLEDVVVGINAVKNSIDRLIGGVVELEKCAAVTKSLEEDKKWSWKTKWWQSREFFLIVIVIMLIILLANSTGVNIVEDIGKLFKSITGIFVKG